MPGSGPGLTGVALATDGSLETLAAFDRELVRAFPYGAWRFPLAEGLLAPGPARGRELFYSAGVAISTRGLTCATCHPDGREDGLVWRINREGLRTPSLASSVALTAPYHWRGSEGDLAHSITTTITQRLGGAGLPKDDLDALAEFVRTGLRLPRKAPSREDPALVALGSALFSSDEVGCGGCHIEDGSYADGRTHDVGTVPEGALEAAVAAAPFPTADEVRKSTPVFDTPSLVDVSLSPPYLHDGSAPTLEAVLERTRDTMGHTSQLSPHEREALVAYLESL